MQCYLTHQRDTIIVGNRRVDVMAQVQVGKQRHRTQRVAACQYAGTIQRKQIPVVMGKQRQIENIQ